MYNYVQSVYFNSCTNYDDSDFAPPTLKCFLRACHIWMTTAQNRP